MERGQYIGEKLEYASSMLAHRGAVAGYARSAMTSLHEASRSDDPERRATLMLRAERSLGRARDAVAYTQACAGR